MSTIGRTPGIADPRSLIRGGRVHRRRGVVEHRQHPVAGMLAHRAARALQRRAQDTVVLLEVRRHRSLVRGPAPRRLNDVAHHEGDERTHQADPVASPRAASQPRPGMAAMRSRV